MKVKAAFALALALPFALLAGCTPQGEKEVGKTYPGTLEDAKVWCVSAQEKVLKKEAPENYDGVSTETLSVTAAKGEYEGAQVILSAEEDLIYEVKAGELTSGSDKFPASNVEIFHEKYINVSKPYGNVPAGYYPDALVPYENIKEAGENVVLAGENQGLYVRFNVPLDQAPGVYTGSITVTVGGESKTVPVSLEVKDVTVSAVNHTQSVFLNEWLFYKGELDSTQEMFDAYNTALYEYRLNPNIILYDFDEESEAGIEAYVEKAWEYVSEYNASTISLPYSTERVNAANADVSALRIEEISDLYVSDHTQYDFTRAAVDAVVNSSFGTYETVDAALMRKYLQAFSEKSFEEGVDLVSRLVTYYRLIDETKNAQGYSTVKLISLISRNTANALADEYLANKDAIKAAYPDLNEKAKESGYASADEFIEGIAESLYDLYHIVTIAANTDYNEILPYLEGGCPLFDDYDTEEGRSHYYSQTQKWWYGCVAPEPPYATYRIDDSMLSPRMVSWMQAQYGVVGNLYWATNIYANNSNWTYQEIYDYYEGNAERYPDANGDGFLFYPGAQYGIDGPVGSLRLEAIRDGIEEYELLYTIQETYNAGLAKDENGDGVNDYFYEMMEGLTSELYVSTVVTADNEAFDAARDKLFTLAELAASPASFSVLGKEDDGAGSVTFSFAVREGTDVSLGEGSCGTLTAGATENGMTKYTVHSDLSASDSNTVRISMTAEGKTFTYEEYLGGRVQKNEAALADPSSDLAPVESGVSAVFEKLAAAESGIAGWTSESVLRADLSKKLNFTQQQAFTLKGSLIAGIGENTASLKLEMAASAGRTVSVVLVGSKGETSLASVTFQENAQTVEVSLSGVNWAKIGEVQCLRFHVASGEDALSIFVGNIVVYGR